MCSNPSLVSVVLCTYNGERFLKEQLDSLIFQSYKPLEIIIFDDCSTDSTYNILSDYKAKYPTICLYRNEKNIGYIKNFEKAIRQCRGEYIALCDQDDVWDLHKIYELVKNINNNILIYHDSHFMDEEGKDLNRKLSSVVNFYTGDAPEAFVFFNCISSHAVMFKKELVNHLLPFPASGFHDAWIGYVACNLGTISLLDKCLVYYRQHTNSATDILKIKGEREKLNPLTRYKNNLDFIHSCSLLSVNKRPEIMYKLYRLYHDRTKKKINFTLMLFFLIHFHAFFFIYKRNFLSKINFIIKHAKGVKTS